jgi:hypothetical protein
LILPFLYPSVTLFQSTLLKPSCIGKC